MLKSNTDLERKFFSFDSILITNLILGFFPISFILGNFAINFNILLFCLLGIFQLKNKILLSKFTVPIKIIFLFFFIVFFSTSLSFILSIYFEGYNSVNFERLIKSILFFRFFLILIIIYLLSEYNILNLKYFFTVAALSVIVVSLDLIYQFIFGYNIIGLESFGYHNTGFFGDERIAGGYIQNFSFFSILFLFSALSNKKFLRFITLIGVICLLGASIVISGNRMPFVLFLVGLIILFIFNSKLRVVIPVGIILILISFQFINSHDAKLKLMYSSLYENVTDLFFSYDPKLMSEFEKELRIEKKDTKQNNKIKLLDDYVMHNRLLLTALDLWKKNKVFGGGIKSFRVDCHKLQGNEYNFGDSFVKSKKNRLCSNHPHNYYFEILVETGIVGFFITLAIAYIFIIFILKNYKLFKGNNMKNLLLLASTTSLILEVFPIKSTGSIFSTYNATYIILISSIILTYYKKMNEINNK